MTLEKYLVGDVAGAQGKMKNIKKLEVKDYKDLLPYLEMRDPHICDMAFIDNYMWHNFSNAQYIKTDKALYWIYRVKNEYFTILPMCKKEDLKESFEKLTDYFNNTLNTKLKIYVADEEGIEILDLNPNEFKVEEVREYFDYVYDAEALKTLAGKKLHKKRNHYNAFIKEYEGRYKFSEITCDNKQDVLNYLKIWYDNKESDDEYNRLDAEFNGIKYIFNNCEILDFDMAVVYVDDKIEAFTLGSLSTDAEMAYIHVEKANPNIRGLYNFINREFIYRNFPNVKLVNREDDMGLEGLRKAKMSYRPLYLAKKYSITQL